MNQGQRLLWARTTTSATTMTTTKYSSLRKTCPWVTNKWVTSRRHKNLWGKMIPPYSPWASNECGKRKESIFAGIPYGPQILIPAAPLFIQLPACALAKQWRTTKSLGTLHPWSRPGRSFWLLALDWHSTGHCAHLGSKSLEGRSSSLSLLSAYPTLQ